MKTNELNIVTKQEAQSKQVRVNATLILKELGYREINIGDKIREMEKGMNVSKGFWDATGMGLMICMILAGCGLFDYFSNKK